MAHSIHDRVTDIWMSVVLGIDEKRSRSWRTKKSQLGLYGKLKKSLPSLAVLAFAKDDNVDRLVLTSSASSFGFLPSRYSCPRPIKTVSYSRKAVSPDPGPFDKRSL